MPLKYQPGFSRWRNVYDQNTVQLEIPVLHGHAMDNGLIHLYYVVLMTFTYPSGGGTPCPKLSKVIRDDPSTGQMRLAAVFSHVASHPREGTHCSMN